MIQDLKRSQGQYNVKSSQVIICVTVKVSVMFQRLPLSPSSRLDQLLIVRTETVFETSATNFTMTQLNTQDDNS
jgi:hypothetical protein